MSKKNNNGLVFAIVFAAVAVSGSLVFLGSQMVSGGDGMDGEELKAQISKGIDNYIEEQEEAAVRRQAEANKPKFLEGDFTDDDPILGDKNAPVVMVEFSDYQCPYCNKFFANTLPQIKTDYIDTGKVKLVYRDLPLSFHPYAYPAALLAECVRDQAGDEAYFKVHDEIFKTIAGGFNTDDMVAFASGLGINEGELNDCIENDKFRDEIDGDVADANRAGINGTPGFIINGMVVSGAQPYGVFKQVIDDALAKQ